MTASEVARRAGIDTPSARTVLYLHKAIFTSIRVTPGRVRWQVSLKQRFAENEPILAQALG